MTDANERVSDIIAEKRFDATTRDQFDSAYIVDFCDRLEAAHKRECGDAAKLREALKATLDLFWDIHNANRSPQSNQAYAVIRQIKAALAATEPEGGAECAYP